MLNKTMIALSAIALLGSVSLASAYEAPEHKIGDRFAHLDKGYAPVSANTTAWRVVNRGQITNVAPEHKLGDRFAFLDMGYAPIATKNVGIRVRSARMAPTQGGYEAPENKIGDRYPFLEHAYMQRVFGKKV